MSHSFVVTVGTGDRPELFGPFESRAKAWKFANKVRCNRRTDAAMPAVEVQPIQPGRLSTARL